MRKIVVSMSVSLDGFMEGPGGDLSWHLVDAELHQHFNDTLRGMSAFLEGRVDYELMQGYWPTADEDPSSTPQEAEFARIWRGMRKYVYSTTLPDDALGDPMATLVRSVDRAEVRALAAQPGGDMGVGGARLIASFREHDLVDEYRLYLHPVVLNRGTPLLLPVQREGSDELLLVGTRTFGNGVVLLHYERVR